MQARERAAQSRAVRSATNRMTFCPRVGSADREIISRISSAVRGETRTTGHRHVDSFLSSVVVNEKFIVLLGEKQREAMRGNNPRLHPKSKFRYYT